MEIGQFLDKGGRLSVRVTPRAARTRVAAEDGRLRVWVTAVPEAGKANAAVIAALAKAFRLPKSAFRLIRGGSGRDKIFMVED